MRKKTKVKPDFDVALSFAGEDRSYVEKVARILREMGFRVFYDKYEVVSLWGKDLYTHLRNIYFQQSKYTVIFVSKHFKKKLWTNHERESAQAKAFLENKEYILPARFDKTRIPGILPTTGYIDLNGLSPSEFADLIKQKIGPIERSEFFPKNPDRLYSNLGVSRKAKKERALIYMIAYEFFEGLKLMTFAERRVLASAVLNTCAAGPPDNVHLKIEYLSRLTSLPKDELKALFSRLDCLYLKARVYKDRSHGDRDKLAKSYDVIEIIYKPLIEDFDGNGTDVMIAIFNCIFDNYCPNCANRILESVDLSILSTQAGFQETHPH